MAMFISGGLLKYVLTTFIRLDIMISVDILLKAGHSACSMSSIALLAWDQDFLAEAREKVIREAKRRDE